MAAEGSVIEPLGRQRPQGGGLESEMLADSDTPVRHEPGVVGRRAGQ